MGVFTLDLKEEIPFFCFSFVQTFRNTNNATETKTTQFQITKNFKKTQLRSNAERGDANRALSVMLDMTLSMSKI